MLKKAEKKTKIPSKVISVRMSEKELQEIEKLARKYTGGNLSWWLKHAGLSYKPGKRELEK